MKISEIPEHFCLITDSCQVSEIRDYLSIDTEGCDSLFVKFDKDGDAFETVYGFEGIIPLLDKTLTLLFPCRGRRI